MSNGLVPFAKHELIKPGANDPQINPVGNVFHVAVSMSPDLHDYFNGPSGGIESHGYILLDGSLKQYRNCNWEADAQSAGNSWFEGGQRVGLLSWESEGMGDGTWTDAQLETIKRIIEWTHSEYSVPLQAIPAWNGHGNGYHCQFPQWNPDNHSCPGPERVKQFNEIIMPWMNQGGGDDMSAKDVWDYVIPVYDKSQKDGKAQAHVVLAQAHNRAGDARALARENAKAIADLAKAIGDTSMSDQQVADIAKTIADRVTAAVEQVDAAAVADQLEVTTKES